MYYAANRLYETADAGVSWRTVSPDLTRENPGCPASVGKMKSAKADKQRGAIYAASPSPLRDRNHLGRDGRWTGVGDA